MSFSAEWLALRAPADARARDAGLVRRLARLLEARDAAPLRILDLGSGTGANMAALAPALPGPQLWQLVDRDAGLLARAGAPEGVQVERLTADLAGDLAPLFEPAPHLVTASALFDLCGAAVLTRIVDATVHGGAAFYTALTYDGRETWSPPHALDAPALAAFHADQRRDKGLGPALGPGATMALAEAFRSRGYAVETAPSDWNLAPPADSALIAALADGSARAVRPALGARTDLWRDAHVRAKRVMIGHLDLLAWPDTSPPRP